MPQQATRAFIAALTGVALLCVLDAVMKTLVLAIGVYALSIWRSAVNVVIAGSLYLPTRQAWPLREALPIHLIRGVIVAVMAPLFIWGISRVALAEAIVLTFTTPLIVSFLAALFLKEHVHRSSLIGSAIAGVGVLVVAFGEVHGGQPMLLGGAAIMGASVCYAANLVLIRRQGRTSTSLEINFCQSVTVAAIWLILAPIGGVPPLANGWWTWIIASSALTIAVGIILAWAYARAQAGYLAATEYTGFVWASLFGWLIFQESPSITTVLGGALIVGGCLIGSMVRRGLGQLESPVGGEPDHLVQSSSVVKSDEIENEFAGSAHRNSRPASCSLPGLIAPADRPSPVGKMR